MMHFHVDYISIFQGPDDVQKLGIKAYNDECRKIVMRYSREWQVGAAYVDLFKLVKYQQFNFATQRGL